METTAHLDDQVGVRVPAKAPKFSDTVLLTGSQVAKWLLRLVFVLSVARALGPDRFGVYALLFAMVEFLAVASGSGYADFLTREAARDARVGWGLASQLMLLRIAIAIPVAAIEVGILALLRYAHPVLSGTAWMALTLAPRSFSEAVQGVLRGLRQYAAYLAIEAVLGGSLAIGAGFLLFRHGGLPMAIATEIAASVAAGLAALPFALKHMTRDAIGQKVSHLVKSSAVFNVYSFIGSLYDRFDVMLLSKLAGDYATGIYSVAYRALGMTQILAYGLLYSLLPVLSQSAGSPGSAEDRRRLERAMGFLLSAAFAVVLATMVFAGPAVRLLLGEQYAESSSALKILIWAVMLRYVNSALNIALLAAGRERVFIVTSLVCLAVNLIGNLVFIPVYSWRAAAVMTIATELALLMQNLYWVRRASGRVALPWGMARSSGVFTLLLGVALAGRYCGLPLVAGTLCLLVFAAYLYASGMVTEFATVWGDGCGPALNVEPPFRPAL
jgi:O-antigen/teichoic acid export membrane protein